MVATSSTFLVVLFRDLSRLLHVVRHGTEPLVYSHHPREAATSTCLAIIFGWIMGVSRIVVENRGGGLL